jgi:RNA polymerase sigma-70 factor (ECF subfamily)
MSDKNISSAENSIPDHELIRKIKLNDQESFKILYYRYFKKMISYAWYRTGSIDNSKEHVQELFSRIWIKRDQLNPEKSVKSYLYKSLSNIIINHNKLFYTQSKSLDDLGKESLSVQGDNEDLRIDIHDAISKLPEKLRSVFLMSRLDRFSYSEIAEIYNLSVKTVEKRMSKALAQLRIYLVRKNNT